MIKYRIEGKSGKGYFSFVKEFKSEDHYNNWAKLFQNKYKIIGTTKIQES